MAPAPPQERRSTRADQSGNFSWSNDGEKLEVNYKGTIEFTDDDMDVKSAVAGRMAPHQVERQQAGDHTGEVRANASGNMTRRFWAGRTEKPFEPEGRQWLATMLPRFIRQTAIGAPARVERIYKAKGAQGVLAEIALDRGKLGEADLFHGAVQDAGLDPATVRQAVVQAGRDVDSDFELASLLIDDADRLLTSDEATRQAYIEAARTIESDFEMRRVYSSALKRGPVSRQRS